MRIEIRKKTSARIVPRKAPGIYGNTGYAVVVSVTGWQSLGPWYAELVMRARREFIFGTGRAACACAKRTVFIHDYITREITRLFKKV